MCTLLWCIVLIIYAYLANNRESRVGKLSSVGVIVFLVTELVASTDYCRSSICDILIACTCFKSATYVC